MSDFSLHPQLAEDCHCLGRLAACHLLLHRNASLPWFILVPETDALDLLDLPRETRIALMDDATAVSCFVKESLGYPKVNFGAIGNLVPQMHLHVIGRRPGDACWPSPVWGHLADSAAYEADRLAEITDGLAATGRLVVASDEG